MAPLKTYGSKKRKLLISKDKINAKKSIKNARRPLATLQSENIVIPELVKCKTTQKTVSVENKDVTNTSPSLPGSELSSIWNCDSTFDKLLQPTTKPKPAHKDVVDNVRSLGSEVTKTNPNKLTETPTINTLPSRSKYYKLRLLNKENSGKSSDSSSHACLACSNPSITSTYRSENSRQITSTPNVNESSDNAKFLEFTPIYPEAERTRCEKSHNLQVRHESLVGSSEVVCSPKMEPELPFVSSPDMFSSNEISSCVPQARKISVRQSLRQLRSSISSSNYLVPCDENINKCGDNVSQSTRGNSSISTNCGERVNNEHQEEESANSLGNNISSKTQLSPIASESDNNSDEAMDDVVSSPIIYDTRLRNRKVRWNDHSSLKNHSGSMSKKSVCEDSQDISAEEHLDAGRTPSETSSNSQVHHTSLVGIPDAACIPKMEPELPFACSTKMFFDLKRSSCVPQAGKKSIRQTLKQLRSSIGSCENLPLRDKNINSYEDNISENSRDNSKVSINSGERAHNKQNFNRKNSMKKQGTEISNSHDSKSSVSESYSTSQYFGSISSIAYHDSKECDELESKAVLTVDGTFQSDRLSNKKVESDYSTKTDESSLINVDNSHFDSVHPSNYAFQTDCLKNKKVESDYSTKTDESSLINVDNSHFDSVHPSNYAFQTDCLSNKKVESNYSTKTDESSLIYVDNSQFDSVHQSNDAFQTDCLSKQKVESNYSTKTDESSLINVDDSQFDSVHPSNDTFQMNCLSKQKVESDYSTKTDESSLINVEDSQFDSVHPSNDAIQTDCLNNKKVESDYSTKTDESSLINVDDSQFDSVHPSNDTFQMNCLSKQKVESDYSTKTDESSLINVEDSQFDSAHPSNDAFQTDCLSNKKVESDYSTKTDESSFINVDNSHCDSVHSSDASNFGISTASNLLGDSLISNSSDTKSDVSSSNCLDQEEESAQLKPQLSPIASESDNNSHEALDEVVSSPIKNFISLRNRKVRWIDHSSSKCHSESMSEKSVWKESHDISAEEHLESAPVSKTASEIVPPVMVRPSAAFNRRTSIWQSSRVRAASRRFSVVPGKLLAKPRQDSLGFRGFHGILAPEAQELENFYAKLGETFGNISIASTDESKNIPANVSINITARDVVLQKCGQEDPLPFSDIFPEEYLSKCRKIGEGLYGEVFMWESGGNSSVLKIIPIDGDELINGERQKTFDEILSEIVITKELSDLRYESHDGSGGDLTSGFVEVKRTACVMGKYPPRLLQLWEDFAEESGTENDNPEVFSETQLFIVLELANGGADLEKYVFNNASQALSVFLQTAYALAAAERRIEFEHRDLHWGNVLVSKTDVKQVNLVLNGTATKVATHGVQVSIIDFTLSRMTYDGCCIYNDLSQDDSLFVSEGDYQFDVYRLMKENCRNNWQEFVPANNILWLHYLVDKMLMGVHYRRTASKVHRDNLKKLRSIEKSLLDFTSTTDFIESQVQI